MAIIDDTEVDQLANSLFTSLTADAPTPPTVDLSGDEYKFSPDKTSDLYTAPDSVTLAQLTEVNLEGAGVFDKLMAAVDLHIQREYSKGRITGDQYAKVYTEVLTAAMTTASSFLLAKDKARWDAITSQMQARMAEVQAVEAVVGLEKTKIETQKAIFEMQNSGAEYALTKMNIANADIQYLLTQSQVEKGQYEVSEILPVQKQGMEQENNIKDYTVRFLMPADLSIKQYERMEVMPSTVNINKVQSNRILPAEASIKEFTHRELQPIERDLQKYELENMQPVKFGIDDYQLKNILPVTLAQEQHKLNHQMPAQTNLIKEQHESQRAQTMETRSDGLTAIGGILGKQKLSLGLDVDTKQYGLDETLPAQLALIKEQRESERAKTLDNRSDLSVVAGVTGRQNTMVTKQTSLLDEQIKLTKEQTEAERAKTLDTRTDAATVKGSVGKQKDLYTQQIDSFVKDAKHKAAKMYLDGWITQKTLDEGLTAPNQLTNTNVDSVLQAIRTANSL
jgi:hypothetical protein